MLRSARPLGFVVLVMVSGACGTRVGNGATSAAAPLPSGAVASALTGQSSPLPAATTAAPRSETTAPGPAATAATRSRPDVAAGPAPVPSTVGAKGGGTGAAGASAGPASPATPTTQAPVASPSDRVPVSTEPIPLGNVGTYSGPAGSSLAPAQRGIQVWAQDLNRRGGISGRPVKLITADDGLDPARTQALVKEMVERYHVAAFVGNTTPFTLGSYVHYVEQQKIPVIGGDLIALEWFQSPAVFPQGPELRTMMLGIADLLAGTGKKKVATVYCGEVQVCRDAQKYFIDAAPKVGLEVVYTTQISLAQPDFTAECVNASSRGAEMFGVWGDANTLHRVANSCARQGFKPIFSTGGPAVVNNLADNPNLDGLLAPTATFPWTVSGAPAFDAYQSAIRSGGAGAEPSSSTSSAWTSGKLFEAIAAKAGGDIRPASLLMAAGQVKNETLGGLSVPLTFISGQPTKSGPCYFAQRVTGGKWVASEGATVRCARS